MSDFLLSCLFVGFFSYALATIISFITNSSEALSRENAEKRRRLHVSAISGDDDAANLWSLDSKK